MEEKVGVWAERIGIRVEQSVGDGGGAPGMAGEPWQPLKERDSRQTLTTADVIPRFGRANIGERPFLRIRPTAAFPKRIQEG